MNMVDNKADLDVASPDDVSEGGTALQSGLILK